MTTITQELTPYEYLLRLNPDGTHGMYYEQLPIFTDENGVKTQGTPRRLSIQYTPSEVVAIVGELNVELAKRLDTATARIAELEAELEQIRGDLAGAQEAMAADERAITSLTAQIITLQQQLAAPPSGGSMPPLSDTPPAS